jgi:hypothetical protein
MRVRAVTIALTAIDCVAAAALVIIFFLFSGSDPATRGFDIAGAWLIALLLFVTGLPALLLAFMRRAPRTALVFALTFPVGFVLVYIAAVIAFII